MTDSEGRCLRVVDGMVGEGLRLFVVRILLVKGLSVCLLGLLLLLVSDGKGCCLIWKKKGKQEEEGEGEGDLAFEEMEKEEPSSTPER